MQGIKKPDTFRGALGVHARVFTFTLAVFSVFVSLGRPALAQRSSSAKNDYAVIGVESDADNLCPLFAQTSTADEIIDLIYPCLVEPKFDTLKGELVYLPGLAKSWESRNHAKDVLFHLRSDAKWSDGQKITASDVQFSYVLYADTTVGSVRQGSMDEFVTQRDGSLDIRLAIEVINDTTLFFHFKRAYAGQLFDAGLPIMPVHSLAAISRPDIRNAPYNRMPVGAGPFKLDSWKPGEEIVLSRDGLCRMPAPAKLERLVFRIVPDYHARLEGLKSGEIDVIENPRVEDAAALGKNPSLHVTAIGARFYDAINWNNIDPDIFTTSKGSKILPNPLFGSANVRKALTMGINRAAIVKAYLAPFGRECVGPVSPIFAWAFDKSLHPLPFDPKAALALLASEGWKDSDGDGILDRNGKKFSFTLLIPAGNQVRSTVAAIVQNQLRAIKIDVKIEQLERSAFFDKVGAHNFEACIAGISVPLQLQLDDMWGSDLDKAAFNFAAFRDASVDTILSQTHASANTLADAPKWKRFQKIIHDQQPCTFLYWQNDLAASSKRIGGIDIGVLGTTHQAGEWYVASGQGGR